MSVNDSHCAATARKSAASQHGWLPPGGRVRQPGSVTATKCQSVVLRRAADDIAVMSQRGFGMQGEARERE